MKCKQCGNEEMELLPVRHPYITKNGIVFQNIQVDVYKCPQCGQEQEVLPNNEDGYSAGAGLFSDE